MEYVWGANMSAVEWFIRETLFNNEQSFYLYNTFILLWVVHIFQKSNLHNTHNHIPSYTGTFDMPSYCLVYDIKTNWPIFCMYIGRCYINIYM